MSGGLDVNCDPSKFGAEFGAILNTYKKELTDELKKDVTAAGRIASKEVKNPPAGAGTYRDWDDYASGWRSESEFLHGMFTVKIRNRKKPGLTHLLEKGHVVHTKSTLSGWRSATNAAMSDGKHYSKRFPHIEPAAEKAVAELTRRINEKGGRLK